MRFFRVFLVIFGVFACVNSAKAFDSLVIEPSFSIEYAGVEFGGNGDSSDFENKSLEKQIGDFENIALGLHLRVHKYIGVNINWSQYDADNPAGLSGISTSSSIKPELRLDYTNYSMLFFLPFVEDSKLEGFLELGVSDMYENLSYVDGGGNFVNIEDHQSNPLVGIGLNYLPFDDSYNALRFSFHRYVNKLNTTGADMYGFRVGYLLAF